MPIQTTDELVQSLRQSGLLEPAQLEELTATLLPRCPDPRTLARELL
jgi:hypothetical protein